MRTLFIFILTLFLTFSLRAQTPFPESKVTYDYDTTLKGGYYISFEVNDSLQYLILMKGNKTIIELASTSRGLPHKNLGYVGADFSDYFVLVHSFGSGNPHIIELIKKSTGENVLNVGAAWIDANEKEEYLLYSESDVPKINDRMTLLYIQTGAKHHFNFPTDIFNEPEVLNRIQINCLTEKQLVVKYQTKNGAKTKVYNR